MRGKNGGSFCLVILLLTARSTLADGALYSDASLSAYAEAGIRLFDPHQRGVDDEFREFLHEIPMTNLRPVPEKLVTETATALTLYRRPHVRPSPAYFVATNFDKSINALFSPREKSTVRLRYGEDIYPQVICPVFASHAGRNSADLLSEASGLPAAYFASAPGSRDNYHYLFLLTEASHCGFLARTIYDPTLRGALRNADELRAVLEGIGDFEASALFHNHRPPRRYADEADVLFAARVLAMFLRERTSAYTAIPALTLAYLEHGIIDGSTRIAALQQDVAAARLRFRKIAGASRRLDTSRPEVLAALAEKIERTLRAERHSVSADPRTTRLLALFPAAVRTLQGQAPVGLPRPGRPALETLPGAESVLVAATT